MNSFYLRLKKRENMKQELLDKIEQISDEVTSSSCNNGDSKLITGLLDELTEVVNKNYLLSDVSGSLHNYTESDVVTIGNRCWWESKKYWDENQNGEKTAKTIIDIIKEWDAEKQ